MRKLIIRSVFSALCATVVGGFSNVTLAAGGGHGGGHHVPDHAVGLFLGGTTGAGHTDYTIGLEYEYRVNEKFGFGPIIEFSPDAHGGDGVSVYMAGLHFHPFGGLRLTGGVGAEVVHAHGGEAEEIFRLGAAYDIELGNAFAIAPTVNVDFVNGHELVVFGVVLIRHW